MSKRSSGGIAVIAVLVGIIIIAVGTAVLFLTDKNRISENKNVPAVADSLADSSSLAEMNRIQVLRIHRLILRLNPY